ncbi:unnamed protein product [Symbiodinium natans]|uniref:Reverse transcriptase domain-containing protein n=1 Tax=Symbiodinium natans TaxID=878477 RepID=A0A812UA71_9DINO|nr:unnamed protein product [Symbiodinium natans]
MKQQRPYFVCKKCGPESWIFCDRAAKAETCHLCGGRWPKYKEQPSSKPERVWRSQQAVQPKGFRQDGKIHKALGAGGHLGKGKGKGKQSEPAEHDSAHQALWESASSEQRAWLHQLGFQCPSPSEPSDLKTLINAHMDQLPETLRQAIASLEPPEPEPSATEQVLSATKKFKASTNELRQLIQKSAGLQVKIDRAKATYADLLDQMKAVQTELADKQLEVTKLQKELESKVQSGAGLPILPGKEAVLLALTQCGITLSSEQQALLEGSMDVEPAPLVAPKPHNTEEEILASAPQPQGAQPPADWPDGPREGKHRSPRQLPAVLARTMPSMWVGQSQMNLSAHAQWQNSCPFLKAPEEAKLTIPLPSPCAPAQDNVAHVTSNLSPSRGEPDWLFRYAGQLVTALCETCAVHVAHTVARFTMACQTVQMQYEVQDLDGLVHEMHDKCVYCLANQALDHTGSESGSFADEGDDVEQPFSAVECRLDPFAGQECPAEASSMPRVVGARADCSSHRIGRSGQQRLTPAEAAAAQMWKQVHQSIHQGNEEKLLDAIETLEKGGHMHEGTFAWTAAELAIQSRFDVPTHVAAWAAEDVLANFGTKPARSNLTFVSANVTRWRKDLAPWIGQHRPSVCILQETHVHPDQGDLIATHMAPFGYNVLSVPGHPTGSGGTSGGFAVCYRKHLDVRTVHQYVHQGTGFQAVAMRVRNFDCFFVNVYLKAGEGFQSSTNALILSHLIPFLRSVRGEFVAVGDFNEDFEILAGTSIAQEAKGQWISAGESTCAGGGNIDFGLLSPCLATGASLNLDWITPFAPHAALHWTLSLQHLEVNLPQLCRFKSVPVQPQPFHPLQATTDSAGQPGCQFQPAQDPTMLGVRVVNHDLSGFFANLSGAIELSVYGVMQGRGSIPKMSRSKLLTPVMPAASWGGSETSFWNRVVVWLEGCVRKFHASSFALGAAKRIPEMWHGNHSQQEAFVTDLVALLRDHSEALVQPLLQVAREQRKYHAQAWAKQKSSSYICWLKHSSQKGMRPLFRSVKAEEAIHIRPFTDAPVQERIYLRWRQWFDLWTQPTGVDPELLCELRRRAVEQAGSLDPIPLDKAVAYFKKVPTKAPGLDGWTCEVLHNLQPNAVQAILDFFRHCELEASWPDQFVFSLIALLPKSEKRERPIALMHILYRSWVRLRWKLVADWQQAYSRQASWDKAVPGSQVLDVALSRLVLGESVRHQKHHLITLFLDLETFYDRCRFDDIIRSGFQLGYPPLVLHQAVLTYLGPRFVQSEGSLCPPILPSRGVLAGCPAAPSVTKLVIHPIAERLMVKRSVSNLDIWLDDLSLDSISKSASQVASDSLVLFRGLRRDFEARGAKLSVDKSAFVASSPAAAKALQSLLEPTDPKVKTVARDLGVSSGGARRRVLGVAEQRRRKAIGRPLAATQAYLLELGVSAPQATEWQFGTRVLRVDWTCLDAVRQEATACVPALSAVGSVTDGLWSQSTVLSSRNLVFATDASGGPGAKDPRSICVSWAIAAYQIEEGVPQRVASVTCFPESPLSVAQAEQQAVRELFARVEGAFDATIDCKSITSILKKATPPMEGPVDWGNVWQERDRADLHWVPSHKTKDYFAERNIPEWLIQHSTAALCVKLTSCAKTFAFILLAK